MLRAAIGLSSLTPVYVDLTTRAKRTVIPRAGVRRSRTPVQRLSAAGHVYAVASAGMRTNRPCNPLRQCLLALSSSPRTLPCETRDVP